GECPPGVRQTDRARFRAYLRASSGYGLRRRRRAALHKQSYFSAVLCGVSVLRALSTQRSQRYAEGRREKLNVAGRLRRARQRRATINQKHRQCAKARHFHVIGKETRNYSASLL